MSTLLSVIALFSIAYTTIILPDERGQIKRANNRNIPQFRHQSPSLNAFTLPQRIRDEYGIEGIGAGSGPGMYGIAGPSYIDGYAALVKYDTETGNTTTVQTPNGNPLTGESLGCLDNIHKVFNDVQHIITPYEYYQYGGLL